MVETKDNSDYRMEYWTSEKRRRLWVDVISLFFPRLAGAIVSGRINEFFSQRTYIEDSYEKVHGKPNN